MEPEHCCRHNFTSGKSEDVRMLKLELAHFAKLLPDLKLGTKKNMLILMFVSVLTMTLRRSLYKSINHLTVLIRLVIVLM